MAFMEEPEYDTTKAGGELEKILLQCWNITKKTLQRENRKESFRDK